MSVSENGWPASRNPDEIGVKPFTVAGRSFPGGVKGGDVAAIMKYLVAQYHLRVESLYRGDTDKDDWGWNYRPIGGSSTLSNHSSGTAVDVNATTNQQGTGYSHTYAQVQTIRTILKECGGVVRWGGDFSRSDPMHFEICKTPAEVRRAVAYRRSLPWFTRDLIPVGDPDEWQHGGDVYHVQARLGVRRTYKYDVNTVNAVKMFQKRLLLTPNGKVTRGLAYFIG
jgi:hypothetical protein